MHPQVEKGGSASQCLPFEKSHDLQIFVYIFQYFHLEHVLYYTSIWKIPHLCSLVWELFPIHNLVFFYHGIHPLFILNGFFKESRFLFYEITHQGHITGECIRFLYLSHGSFWGSILLSILNKFPFPIWLSLVRDHHLGRFLRFCHIIIFWNLIIRGNCNFLHWFCNSGSYKLFFI
jgi:hypothetical protein